ncbi:MAG: autotransporter-associated beta strand repeat-containing protein [bacterium]
MKHRVKAVILTAIAVLGFGGNAGATDYTRNTAGKWSSTTDWSPSGSYPDSTNDTVSITYGSALNLVLDVDATVKSFTMTQSGWNLGYFLGTNTLILNNGASEALLRLRGNSYNGFLASTTNPPIRLDSNTLLDCQVSDQWALGPNNNFLGAGTLRIWFYGGNRQTLRMSGKSTHTGGTTIERGDVRIMGNGTLGANTISINPATGYEANLLLDSVTNTVSGQAIIVNSTANGMGGLGVAFTPASLAGLNVTGINGGVYGINYDGAGGVASMADLDTAFGANTAGGYHWFLGSQSGKNKADGNYGHPNPGTSWASGFSYTGSSLAPASDNIWRLGGGSSVANITDGQQAGNISKLTLSAADCLSGSGSVIIGSTNTYNSCGYIKFSAPQSYTGSTTINSGSYLEFNYAATNTYVGMISGAGALFKGGTGKLSLLGTNTYSGATTISGGGMLEIGGKLLGNGAITINDIQSGLAITQGGEVRSTSLSLNSNESKVTVTDSGSIWTNNGALTMGKISSSIIVTNQGKAWSAGATIGKHCGRPQQHRYRHVRRFGLESKRGCPDDRRRGRHRQRAECLEQRHRDQCRRADH